MSAIRIKNFIGEIPRASKRLLPDNAAQEATNCKLWSRELRPWRKFSAVVNPTKGGPLKSIYPLGSGTDYWMHESVDVNYARGPIAGDTTKRTYFTGTDAPRVTDNALVNTPYRQWDFTNTDDDWTAVNGTLTPGATALGVAATAADLHFVSPTLSIEGSTHRYVIVRIKRTALTTWVGTCYYQTAGHGESASYEKTISVPDGIDADYVYAVWDMHNLTNGGTDWRDNLITGIRFDFTDTNGAAFSVDLVSVSATATLPDTAYPTKSYLLGVPAPSAAPAVALDGTGTGTAVNRAYVITHVTAWGEESAPSAASSIIAVKSGETVTVNTYPALPNGDYQFAYRRIYRVATGLTGAEYRYVTQLAIGTASYVDSLTDAQLGAALETAGWIPPPATLSGLLSLPNGVMAGFDGNQVYLSPAYVPYAYPLAYRQITDFPVVALGHFGSTIVAATKSTPYLINGIDPAYAAPSKYSGILPCVSKRGLVSSEYGVLYPSSVGLVRVTNAGADVITLGMIDADDWIDFKPDTMHAVFYNGMYIAFYETSIVDGVTVGRGIIIEGIGSGDMHLTELDFYRYATFLDPDTNSLYMADFDGTTNTIEKWEGGIERDAYVWRSKAFGHRPMNLTAGKVLSRYADSVTAEEIAAYQALHDAQVAANVAVVPLGLGAVNVKAVNVLAVNESGLVEVVDVPVAEESSVEFRLYGDGVLRHTETVNSNEAFRIPDGDPWTETEVEVSGVAPVTDIIIAENVAELSEP